MVLATDHDGQALTVCSIGEQELRHLFEGYGIVQSCIVNQDKRHAFIKMLTREDAVRAKDGMETYRTDSMTLRVLSPSPLFTKSGSAH